MLPLPPDWPREFSETPRSKFCGISLIMRSTVTALELSISSRPSEITVEPTGATPRRRLPVTTISPSASPATAAASSSAWSWAAAGTATVKTPSDTPSSRWLARSQHLSVVMEILLKSRHSCGRRRYRSRCQGEIDARCRAAPQPHGDVRWRIETNGLEVALARIGAGDHEAQPLTPCHHERDRRQRDR